MQVVVAAVGKIKRWLTRKRQPRQSPVSLGPPPALLERYLQYKRLLAANSAILTTVTDLQTKMGEGFLFDMHYVRQACQRLEQDVEAMVTALIAMSGGRYTGLENTRQQVAERIALELAGPKMTPVPLALPLEEVKEGLFFGGKAEKLGELTRLGLPVPQGFAVSAYAQKLFFEESGLEDFIRKNISHSHVRFMESLKEASEAIRQQILEVPLPRELSEVLSERLDRLGADRVAVRSSGLQEDSQFSFAGQFDTALNVPRDLVELRYKEVVASQFTPRALF
jgi:pyruvate,water dikinase